MPQERAREHDTIPCPDSRSGTWPIDTAKHPAPPRVLLVDANCNAAAEHARILRDHGTHVRVVECLQAAHWFAALEPFDAIIAGVPHWDDGGLALCAELRKHNPRLPVLLLCDDPSTWTSINDLNDPVLSCLTKPFSAQSFQRHVSSLIESVRAHFEQLDGR